MGPTQALAEFVVNHRYQDLPGPVIHEGKRSLLNWLGVAVGGAHHPTVDIAMRVSQQFAGPPVASVFGRDHRTDLLNASFLNGTSSHVFDFDDTHLETIIHPSGPVAAPLFALAERDGVSGQALIHAFALGVDAECRIGLAVYPSHYDVGWHITGTAGVFGAAIAAAKLLGLDVTKTQQAIGLAASQASGLREMFGTMTKPFHVGHAGKNGLLAALLAEAGFSSSLHALEAKRGFANVLATEHDLSEVTDGLGERFELSKNTYKPFACGIVIHPSIDGCIQLRQRLGAAVDQVASVELEVHPLVLELTGKTEPRTGLEGKFSVFHSAAAALADGEAGERQYSDERVHAPQLVDLRRKVRATANPAIREDEARVRVTTTDGKVHEVHVEHALGSLARPMSDHDLEAKFLSLTTERLGETRARQAIDIVWALDGQPDMGALVHSVTPGETARQDQAATLPA